MSLGITRIVVLCGLVNLFVLANGQHFDLLFDNILKGHIKARRELIDPVNVTDVGLAFSRKVGLFNVRGEIKFDNVLLTGLSSIKRSGDSVVENLVDGQKLYTIGLSAQSLNLSTTGRIKFLGIGNQRDFKGGITSLQFILAVKVNGTAKPIGVQLDDFKLIKLDGLNLQTKGAALRTFDFFTNTAIRASLATFRRTIKLTVEMVVKRILASVIQTLPGLLAKKP